MKNPWQQAVAPIPVTSRCALLEFVCSMALYVLHVLLCQDISWECLLINGDIPDPFPILSGDEHYTNLDWP
jgi:hypothetical protein